LIAAMVLFRWLQIKSSSEIFIFSPSVTVRELFNDSILIVKQPNLKLLLSLLGKWLSRKPLLLLGR
jgi:hypothetical protein